jgi:hypothetical protein
LPIRLSGAGPANADRDMTGNPKCRWLAALDLKHSPAGQAALSPRTGFKRPHTTQQFGRCGITTCRRARDFRHVIKRGAVEIHMSNQDDVNRELADRTRLSF